MYIGLNFHFTRKKKWLFSVQSCGGMHWLFFFIGWFKFPFHHKKKKIIFGANLWRHVLTFFSLGLNWFLIFYFKVFGKRQKNNLLILYSLTFEIGQTFSDWKKYVCGPTNPDRGSILIHLFIWIHLIFEFISLNQFI